MSEKEKALKNIRIFGTVYVVIAIAELASTALSTFARKKEIEASVTASGIDKSLFMIAFGIIAAFAVISVLMKLYVGIKGFTATETKRPGKVAMNILMFLLVVSVLSFISALYSSIKNGLDFTALGNSFVSIMLAIQYRIFIKAYEKILTK